MKVAILYQANPPPSFNGITKPMKDGGYSDSGADIAHALIQNKIDVIVPRDSPNIDNDHDWVFPDTEKGIALALDLGADTIWLNTVLYKHHPIINFSGRKLRIVGQEPNDVEKFDDKYFANNFLRTKQLPIANSFIIGSDFLFSQKLDFPKVLKPIRGRGSQGVSVVEDMATLMERSKQLFEKNQYGTQLILEDLLPGKEITISIMPPGEYLIDGKIKLMKSHWSLPPVLRFNHVNNVAPYNGVVAVTKNSHLLSSDEIETSEIKKIRNHCEKAAQLLKSKATIRIDCRMKKGEYYIFDVNLKPNMTGSSRPHRSDQDSLTMIAAKGIGWSYNDLVNNILLQNWKL